MKKRSAQFAFVTILGISFWFFLAFPFGNHNESYRWIAPLNDLGLTDWLTQGVVASTFRPLGQVTAWLSYRVSGGSMYPIQFLNYAVAVAAWLLAFASIREKRVFGLASLLAGGVFFSGYIYLFHIHGVFYSPILLLTAAMLWLSGKSVITVRYLAGITFLAIAFSLYHPFALPICLAFLVGLALDKRPDLTKVSYLIAAAALLAALASMRSLEQGLTPPWSTENVLGFLTSFRMVEVHPLVSVLGLLFAVGTAASLDLSRRAQAIWLLLFGSLAVVFFVIGVPVILVWILSCLLKMLVRKHWPVAALLLATSLLPVLTSVGTPTYTVFSIMVCSFAMAWGWSSLDDALGFVDRRFTIPLYVALLLLLVGLRSGLNVPIISKLSQPILAEKEKTFQLETIIEWMMTSSYAGEDLSLGQEKLIPREAGKKAIDRTHVPPTTPFYLRKYLVWRRGEVSEARVGKGEVRLVLNCSEP